MTAPVEHIPLTPEAERRWTRVGVLAAFAMLLGYLETFIPIPIPGVKLGLANIPVLVALASDDVAGAACIATVKVLASGLLFGSPIMMAYSAAGTALALVVMAPLSKLKTMRLVMTSIVGAIAHEAGQLAVASVLLGTSLVWVATPVLLVAGCITGALCGVVANRVAASLERKIDTSSSEEDGGGALPSPDERVGAGGLLPARAGSRWHVNAKIAIVVFIVYCIVTLHASGAPALIGCLLVAAVACVVGGVKPKSLARAIRPVAAILVITFVAQVINLQQGTVLFSIGPVAITEEALVATATMVARLVALTAASIAFMHLVRIEDLVAGLARPPASLRKIGLHTEGLALALSVALQTLPVLADTADKRFGGLSGKLFSPSFWNRELPLLVAELYELNSRASSGNEASADTPPAQTQA